MVSAQAPMRLGWKLQSETALCSVCFGCVGSVRSVGARLRDYEGSGMEDTRGEEV